ncbi:MAG: 16S rRNA (uracil(1498)-N(3))-methyltransferase [Micavibrio sp.]
MMRDDDFFKLPRLYVDAPLSAGVDITLSADQAHYFKTVLRRQDGDQVRLFNGRDGEWLCALTSLGKKDGLARPERQIKAQPTKSPGIHLYFAPIKKARMDWLVEKAIELGATDLHPVITQNTEVRDVNAKRLQQQMFEAAEQCERLDLPALHDLIKLQDLPNHLSPGAKLFACLERGETLSIETLLDALPGDKAIAILIGPEGGFTASEADWIGRQKDWSAASLGPRILRCETAVCVALSAVMLR